MTREECIKRLEYTKLRMKDTTYSPETQEALDMAIRSLEAWDYIIEDIRNRGGEFFSADTREIVELIEDYLKEVTKGELFYEHSRISQKV